MKMFDWLRKRVKKKKKPDNRQPYYKVHRKQGDGRKGGGRKDFYTTPGTFDVVEKRLHKFTPREKPTKSERDWNKELDNWVKKTRR